MNDDSLVLFSRALRWLLGSVFIAVGVMYFREGGWPAIVFGAVMIITGFLRPKRCLGQEDGACGPEIKKQN